MKGKLLMLGAAVVLFVSGAAWAAPQSLEQLYVASVAAQAEARLAKAGVALPTPTVRVHASLSGDRLSGVRVLGSTGDLNADHAVEQALRKMPVSQVPDRLVGRDLVLTLGAAPIVQARTP